MKLTFTNLRIKMINGDNVKGIWDRLAYFPQCLIAAIKGSSRGLKVMTLDLETIDDISLGYSPSRQLSNMFWEIIDWDSVRINLEDNLKIFDVACGAGQYGIRYKNLSSRNFSSYTGIDIYKDKDFPEEFSHVLDDAKNSSLYLDGHNFITSQSGLEHIEEDLHVLREITNSLCNKKTPFIQIHLVPATASLFLYLWHGWRVYSKRNLGSVSKILIDSNDVNTRLIPLGGWLSFITHFRYITIPTQVSKIFRTKNQRNWIHANSKASNQIKSAVLNDKNVNDRFPLFWAFIITSKEINIGSLFKRN